MTLCGFKAFVGLPCPLCGGVRATAALGRGAFAEAVAWNPAVVLLHAGMLGSGLALVLDREPPWLAPGRQGWVFRAAAVTLLVNWVYLVGAGR